MAIVKTKISRTIDELNKLYNKTGHENFQAYYSKLALLELCGWVEQSIDDIILSCAKRCLKNNTYIKHIESEVKKNSAFDYEYNFRNLLIQVIGLINFEKLEKNVQPISLAILPTKLRSLKQLRNSHAHTHIHKCTTTLNAPSVTQRDFVDIFKALKDYEQTLKKIKL